MLVDDLTASTIKGALVAGKKVHMVCSCSIVAHIAEEDRRRGRRTRGSRYSYGSGFLFFLFFYSFAEYVDVGFLNYIVAPGSFHGAEGK